jgi:hypothetical protein
MPERRDKNGPPTLVIDVHCERPECRHVGELKGADADRVATRLWAVSRRAGKLHIREAISRLTCKKCRHRLASAHFKLVYRPDPMRQRQHHDRDQFLPDERA